MLPISQHDDPPGTLGDQASDRPAVLLDGAAFTNGYQKGIARYVTELVRHTTDACTLVLDSPARASLPERAKILYRPERFATARHDLITRAWRKLGRTFFPTRVDQRAVWHSCYFATAPHPGMPTVVTVHDLIAEVYPHHHGNAEHEVAMRRAVIARAAAIIAVSQATADDFTRVYPELAARVEVIHHGADHLRRPSHPAATTADPATPFVMFVGNRGGYKNWLSVLDALATRGWPPGVGLTTVGPPLGEAEMAAIRYRGLCDRVRHLGTIDDAHLSAAYARAAVFVFPSLMEGFGFPLLEAQAHGTPVAASDIPVFREVGGQAFVPFRPLDPDSIAAAVATAMEPAHAARLRAEGLENVKRFTWAECGRRTEAVWRRVEREAKAGAVCRH